LKWHRDVSLQYRARRGYKQQRKSGKGGSEERMFGFLSPFILNARSSEKKMKEREREKKTPEKKPQSHNRLALTSGFPENEGL